MVQLFFLEGRKTKTSYFFSFSIHFLFVSYSYPIHFYSSFHFLWPETIAKTSKVRIFFFYQSWLNKELAISSPKSIRKGGTPQVPKKAINKGASKYSSGPGWQTISYSCPFHLLFISYSFPIQIHIHFLFICNSHSFPVHF